MNEWLLSLLAPLQEGARSSLDALQSDVSRMIEGRLPDQAVKAASQLLSLMGGSSGLAPSASALPKVQLGMYRPTQKMYPDINPLTYLMNAVSPYAGAMGPILRNQADEIGGGIWDLSRKVPR